MAVKLESLGCSRARRRAFTIVELLVALLIVAVVGTGSIWAFFSRSEVTLDNAVRLLIEDLHLAQNRAIVQHTAVEVAFAPDGSGYAIVAQGDGGSQAEDPDHPSQRCYSSDAVFEGVKIVEADCGPYRCVSFNAQGAVQHAGRITLMYAGEARTIVVDAGRGGFYVPGSSGRGKRALH